MLAAGDNNSIVNQDIVNHPDYNSEVEHLKNTIKELENEITRITSKSSEVHDKQMDLLKQRDNDSRRELYTFSDLQEKYSLKLGEIGSVLDSPYFGRVDYIEDNSDSCETLYIGKVGFSQGSEYGVIDWRMPIATAFYECKNGRAEYQAPGGTYSGTVKLKRQYTIENSELKYFVDDIFAEKIAKAISNTISSINEKTADNTAGKAEPKKEEDISDPVLLEKLRQNSDKKLRDIIETIRAEQNKIIRQPLSKVVVVQGVAGSGKSTVGLHRISYLLYNNRGMEPKKVLVLAPNKVFLDYISELLPGIDAKGVTQLTFEQLAFRILGTELQVSKDEKVEFFVSAANESLYQFLKDAMSSISKFKGSQSFIKLIEYVINKKTNKIINDIKDVSLFDGKLKIDKNAQLGILSEKTPYNVKLRTLKKSIEAKIRNFFDQQSFITEDLGTYRKEAAAFLKSYLKDFYEITPISVYRELYEDDDIYKILYKNRYFSFAAQYTLKILDSGHVEREDLAALCYLKYLTDGIEPSLKYLHIFADEAQDLSPLEFILLRLVSQNNSMTIMGDMNQGVNSHRGIGDWKQLINEVYQDLNPLYFEILNSYRSTKEIVDFSNSLISKGLPKAKPVERNGEEPSIEKFTSSRDGINKVLRMIKYYKSKGCKSIGILAKREKTCKTIYTEINKLWEGPEGVYLIDGATANYHGDISIAPIVLSKGLEFDAVILWNASDAFFTDTDFDLKILYVAITRPMHFLHILYKGNITSHLKAFVKEDSSLGALPPKAEKDSFLSKMYKDFIDSREFGEIVEKSPGHRLLITKLYDFIIGNGIPVYPVFRKEHSSQSQYRVFNFKIQNAKRADWNNIATVIPNKNGLKVFTFRDGQPGESYLINDASMLDSKVMDRLISDIKSVYELRASE